MIDADAVTYEQVMERDGRACILDGHRSRVTLQHILPRAAGGTSVPLDARLAVVLCGSGTTGCHGAVELDGRRDDGWAYDLGYLAKHGRRVDELRVDDDVTWFVWGHHDRVWWELTRGGVRLACPELARPDDAVLRLVDAAIARG